MNKDLWKGCDLTDRPGDSDAMKEVRKAMREKAQKEQPERVVGEDDEATIRLADHLAVRLRDGKRSYGSSH